MSNEALVAIIILLVGAHYANMVYRLHKMEEKLEEMRKDFTASILTSAGAAVSAAQAVAVAAQTLVKNGGGVHK